MDVIKVHRGAFIGVIVCTAIALLISFYGSKLPWIRVCAFIIEGVSVVCALVALFTLSAYGRAIDQEIHDHVWKDVPESDRRN